ncbi:hypothetical protein SNEBB_000686 [Seison nebaliae]|nr:hypothetical protein SNEBB_000686 [Seison nebaliae]
MEQTSKNVNRDFGSFYASNVYELVTKKDYVPPDWPYWSWALDEMSKLEDFQCLQHNFLLKKPLIFLNHGAFGATLKLLLEYNQKLEILVEENPPYFFDYIYFPLYVDVLREIASFVNCLPTQLLPIENVTYGLNVILSNHLTKFDKIVYFNLTYGATKKILRQLKKERELELVQIDLSVPLKCNDIISTFERHFPGNVKLVILDHIFSNTPYVVPVNQLSEIAKRKGCKYVLVDGAHAIGQIPLDLSASNEKQDFTRENYKYIINSCSINFYLTNLHKWMCCMNGSAILWHNNDEKNGGTKLLKPLIHSHGGDNEDLISQFSWKGLGTLTPFLSSKLIFYLLNNNSEISTKWFDEQKKLTDNFLNVVKLDKYELIGSEQHLPSMITFRVSRSLEDFIKSKMNGIMDYSTAEYLQNSLLKIFRLSVPVKCIDSKIYVRRS